MVKRMVLYELHESYKKDLKNLSGNQLLNAFNIAKTYEMSVNYAGNINPAELKDLLEDKLNLKPSKTKEPMLILPKQQVQKTKIYLFVEILYAIIVATRIGFWNEGGACKPLRFFRRK